MKPSCSRVFFCNRCFVVARALWAGFLEADRQRQRWERMHASQRRAASSVSVSLPMSFLLLSLATSAGAPELPWNFVAAELGPSSPSIGTCRQSKTCYWVGAGATGQRTERCTLHDAQPRQRKPCFWLLRGFFCNFCLMSFAMKTCPPA